ncbi:MAG: amidohydrolase family protein [Parvibaculales bacterium]
MIIDVWGQQQTLRHAQDPIFDSLRRWQRQARPERAPSVAETLALMDAGGVDKMLISAWQAPHRNMIDNDEVADFVAQADALSDKKGRFVGVGSVDISNPMEAVREIRRCTRELGFAAIRVLPWLAELPPTDRLFYPIFAACIEAGVPYCTQIGHTGPLMASEVGRPIYLDRVALDFPELTIVAGHIGYPWTQEAVAVATKHDNIYIDTSAFTIARYPPEIVHYLKSNGGKKIMFATNYPMITPAKCLAGLDDLGLSEETRDDFLSGNAKRVFGL